MSRLSQFGVVRVGSDGALLAATALFLAACGQPAPDTAPRADRPETDTQPRAVPVAVVEPWRETTGRDTIARAPRPEPDTLPIHETLTDTALPAYAISELSRLDGSLTPEEWTDRFPRDTLEPLRPAVTWVFAREPFAAEWCLRAQRKVSLRPDGLIAFREAFFYPPDPRGRDSLPAVHHEPRYAAGHCRLGTLAVTAIVEDSSRADSLVGRLRDAFSERFGPGAYDVEYELLDARWWDSNARWSRSDTTWFVYHEKTRPATIEVRAVAWLPNSDIHFERYSGWGPSRRETAHRLRRLGEAAELDEAGLDHLLTLYRAGAGWYWGQGKGWSDSLLLETLSEWLPRAAEMSAPRRAAALLVADRVLSAGSSASVAHRWREGESMRDTLTALGAQWERGVGTSELRYAGNLLWEAYRVDRDSPAGRLAFLHLLERGFGAPCNTGAEGAERVIREATRFLSEVGSDATAPWYRREVHRLVAEAYGDVLLLQQAPPRGLVGMPRDPFTSPAEAREQAIHHYREALALAADDEREYVKLWTAGWRLAAGLLPLETHFVCVSD